MYGLTIAVYPQGAQQRVEQLNASLTPIPDLNADGYVPSSVFPPGTDKAIRSAQERYAEGETRKLLDEAMRHLLVIGNEPHPTLPDYERTKWDIVLWKDYLRALDRARRAALRRLLRRRTQAAAHAHGAVLQVPHRALLLARVPADRLEAPAPATVRAGAAGASRARDALRLLPAPRCAVRVWRRRRARARAGGAGECRDGRRTATADPAESSLPQYLCPEAESHVPVDPKRE